MPDAIIEEQPNPISKQQILDATVLANVIELTVSVVKGFADKDTAGAINNEGMTRQVLSNIVASRIKETIIA